MCRLCVCPLDCPLLVRDTFFQLSSMLPLATGTASPKVLVTVSSNGWPVQLYKHPTSFLSVGQFRMAISVWVPLVTRGSLCGDCTTARLLPLLHPVAGAVQRAPLVKTLQAILHQRTCFLKDSIYYCIVDYYLQIYGFPTLWEHYISITADVRLGHVT